MLRTIVLTPEVVPFSQISIGDFFFSNDKPYVKGNNSSAIGNINAIGVGHDESLCVGENVEVTPAIITGTIRPKTVGLVKTKEQNRSYHVKITKTWPYSNELCVFTNDKATGHIEVNGHEYACKLSILPSGIHGSYVEVPPMYRHKLVELEGE